MANPPLLRAAVLAIMLTMLCISGYHRHRADQIGGRIRVGTEGKLFTFARLIFGPAALVLFLIWVFRPEWTRWTQFYLPLTIRWSGVSLMLLSSIVLVFVLRHLGNNITPTIVTRDNHQLVTTGPYRWVRHPLYTFGGLAAGGMIIATTNWVIALAFGLMMLLLVRRTALEEQELVRKFGPEYQDYMKRTGRFFPRI